MLTRRIFFSAAAFFARGGYRGQPTGASYDFRTRRTRIHFDAGSGPECGEFDHDRGMVSRPESCKVAVPEIGQPGIVLQVEYGQLVSKSRGRRLTVLMPVREGAVVTIQYPNPAHPDLTAIWAIDGKLYYTNNDYRNVYELPQQMGSAWDRPARLNGKK